MSSVIPRASLLLVATALLACKDDSVTNAGTPSTVVVRVYVDADGSASYSAGDVAVAGGAVRLRDAAGDSLVQTTDAAGLATFASVPTGNYTATFGGPAPAGAVLSSANLAAVAAPAQGGQVNAEFRFVYLPGSLAGTVFRDENTNGTYDVGTDTPGPGTTVSLFADSGVTADTLAVVVTGATGEFLFAGLRPGQYTVALKPAAATIQLVGDTIQYATVPPAGQATLDVEFTGSLILSIAAAKLDSGNVVGVEGVVIVASGTYRTQGDNAYIQDTSSGVQVFGLDPAAPLAVGDSVRITGKMGAFAGEFEILQIVSGTPIAVVALGAGTPPAPHIVSGADVTARTYEGELQLAPNLVLTSAIPGGTTAYNLTFSDGTTSFTVRVDAGVVATVPRASWTQGAAYNVAGALGSFNGTAQLKPRGPGDIQTVSTVATAKANSGSVVLMEGVVTVAQGTFRSDNAYFQDASGGVQLFNLPAGLGLAVGDTVRIAGIMGAFAGEAELLRFSSTEPPVARVLGAGPAPAARVVTGTDIVARTYEGELVTVNNAQLTSTIPGGTSGYNLTFNDGTASFTIRIETGIVSAVPRSFWTQGTTYASITGVLGSFNGTAQLKPRGAADIVP